MTTYSCVSYMPAWTCNNGSTLVEVADAREADFGTQMLEAFKQHARITYTFDDTILPSYIEAAIMAIEQALEFPILPRSFDWDVGPNTGWGNYEVPFRNTKAVGAVYDFEPLRGKCIIAAPASWPVTLEIGFDDASEIPADLKLAIFDVASSYEQLRSAAEMNGLNLPASLLTRYGVMRC